MFYGYGAEASIEATTREDAKRSGKPITTLINYNDPVWIGILKRYPDAAKNLSHFMLGLEAELGARGFKGKDINTIGLAAITSIVNQLDASYPHVPGFPQRLYNQILATALPKAIWQVMPSLQKVQKGVLPTFYVTASMLQAAAAPRQTFTMQAPTEPARMVSGKSWEDAIQPRVQSPDSWWDAWGMKAAIGVGIVALAGGTYYALRGRK